jgi:uncharacterized protein (DUF1499 family)
VGLLGAAAFVLGPAAIHLGAASSLVGFRVFALGLVAGLLALVLGSVGLWRTRPGAGRSGRGRAVTGAGLGLAMAAIVLLAVGSAGELPVINDITTDPDDPPAFTAAPRTEGGRGRDFDYPGEAFASQQRKGYPELAPIELDRPPGEVFERAARAAEGLGWEISHRDPGAGALEAVAVTRIFRFVDDVVVRVRPAGSGSRVDVRSRSREGKGDLGANAARIRAFRDALKR